MGKVIKLDRSVVIACDVKDINKLKQLIRQTYDIEGIGGYKLGSILTIRYGLSNLVKVIRDFTDLPIIYDHQKAMTDIPEMGKEFVSVVEEAGVNALIGFPQSGPKTEEVWIKNCKEAGLEAIIGGEMTHEKYRASEGGYIVDEALDDIYLLAARLGVNNFVVPGTRKERVIHYREILRFVPELTFYAPGFIAQGGVISDVAKAAGPRWHAIIGRAIYESNDMRVAAKELTKQLFYSEAP